MQVAMSIVYDILSKRFACTKGSFFDPSAQTCVVYDCLPEEGDRAFAGTFVVSSQALELGSEVADVQKARIIAVCPPGAPTATDCAIVVSASEPAAVVAAELTKGLTDCKDVLKRMSQSALEGAPIADIVSSAHELLGNPVLIHDEALRVRARTENDAMNDAMWNPLDASVPAYRQRVMPQGFPEFIERIRQSGDACSRYKMHNGVIVYSYRTKEIAGAFLVVSLLQKNRLVTDGDKVILKALCTLVEMSMKSNARLAKEELGYNGLLLDALEGRISSPVEFANRMAALGHSLKPYATLMLVSPRKGAFSDRQAQRVIEDIMNTFPFGRGVCYKGNLVFYATHDKLNCVADSIYERFEAFLARFRMVAALGNTRSIDCPVSELYRSASFNMRIGRKIHPGKNLLFVEDCHPYWAYETCLLQGNADLYIHPALNMLREHDDRTKESQLSVLRTLAAFRGNRSLAASELFIQRNTLQARIREIETLCKIDLSDPVVMNHIRRSFELEDYCKGSMLAEQTGRLA